MKVLPKALIPYIATLIISFGFCIAQSWKWFEIYQVSKVSVASHLTHSSHQTTTTQLQTALTDLAKSCGIKRMLHIEFKKNESRILADFEWEASSPATIRFLKEVEESGLIQGCASLVLDATRGRETELHGLASCYSGPGRSTAQANVKLKTERPIKNIFEGADRPIPQKVTSRSEVRIKPSTLKISQVERNDMEQKRREIEAQVSVTGIVRNGISQMAILEVRGAETKSLMVKTGDTVLGAIVKSIDDQQNEVRLQYQTHSEIVLRLRSGQGY